MIAIMTMSDPRLEEFIALWEQAYGERLTAGEARPIAARLVQFYQLIMRPLPVEEAPQSQTLPEPAL
jgi:hypothetical protein